MLLLCNRLTNSASLTRDGDCSREGDVWRLRAGGLTEEACGRLTAALARAGAAWKRLYAAGDRLVIADGSLEAIRGAVEKGAGAEGGGELLEQTLRRRRERGGVLPCALEGVQAAGAAVMGILNVTPDSFSDGGLYFDRERAVARALELHSSGAHIVDIGGESTRPGAEGVSEEEELRRVLPVIERIMGERSIPLSIDTMKSAVAAAALDAGALVVNDVGGMASAGMRAVAAERGCPVVVMHMKGNPRTMQEDPRYADVVYEVASFLAERIRVCVDEGMDERNIVVDPGIGFGKTPAHNLQLLSELDALFSLGRPVLVGASRKSFIRAAGGEGGGRLEGSMASALYAHMMGARILRVHDVSGTVRALSVWDSIAGTKTPPP